MENLITKTLDLNKIIVKQYLNQDSIALDCTIGNGVDTLFLCLNSKFVYGFDIQKIAIENTNKLLVDYNLTNYKLINDSFSNIDNYIKENVDVILFNLGYLPTGDKSITTTSEVTLIAIKKAVEILNINGLISIAIYWGHENGKKEREELLKFVEMLDSSKYHVSYTTFPNQHKCPPELLLITKKRV